MQIIRRYLLTHLILMVAATGVGIFLCFFLYGGIQAIVLLKYLKHIRAIKEISVFKKKNHLLIFVDGIGVYHSIVV